MNFLPEPPQLTPITFGEPTFFEGDLAQATCVLRKGDQPVTFTWVFDDVSLIQSDSIHVIDVGGRTSILTLDPVQAHHQGTYSCSATNAAGRAEVAADLIVNGTLTLEFFSVGHLAFFSLARFMGFPASNRLLHLPVPPAPLWYYSL